MVDVLLTDIEGTTSSIAFVKEKLFPYARARMASFLQEQAHRPEVAAELEKVRAQSSDAVLDTLLRWTDADRKEPPLKALQGLIWEAGYRQGAIKGHVYPDAAQGLRQLQSQGLRLAVYSSGSVHAQKLLFEHSEQGNLLFCFEAFFDGGIGPKKEAESYRRIAEALRTSPDRIAFVSDVESELDAAAAAGLKAVQMVRAADGTVPSARHPQVQDFEDLRKWLQVGP